MILAFAGRRVDAADQEQPRFPLSSVALVRERVRTLLQAHGPSEKGNPGTVVCSAACGADLIALTEARALGFRRKIVLPFSRERFRNTSVTDRPGNWGPMYDKMLDDAEATGDLVVLGDVVLHNVVLHDASDDNAYLAANRTILDMTLALMSVLHQRGSAVLVWEGGSRGDHLVTEEFGAEARKRGLPVIEVLTI